MNATQQTVRRRNGEGSVRPWNGRWRVRWSDLDGVRITRYASTEAEGRAILDQGRADRLAGLPEERGAYTVAAWLPVWLESQGATTIRPRSHERYGNLIAHWISDPVGKRLLRELGPEHVGIAVGRMQRAGMSPTSAAAALGILRRALDAAMRAGYVRRNVARMIDAPKPVYRDIRPPRGDELTALRAAIAVDQWEAYWLCGLLAGLRRGEVLGLTWGNVDLSAGIIRVTGSKMRDSDEVGPAKTKRSVRTLPADPELIAALRRHRDRALGAGVTPHPTAYVFARANGRPGDEGLMGREWRALCERAGIGGRGFRFHDLRHAFATSKPHWSRTYLMRYMGHTNPRQLMVYEHTDIGELTWADLDRADAR